MSENFNAKTIAELCNVDQKTITKWVNKLCENENFFFTTSQAIEIMTHGGASQMLVDMVKSGYSVESECKITDFVSKDEFLKLKNQCIELAHAVDEDMKLLRKKLGDDNIETDKNLNREIKKIHEELEFIRKNNIYFNDLEILRKDLDEKIKKLASVVKIIEEREPKEVIKEVVKEKIVKVKETPQMTLDCDAILLLVNQYSKKYKKNKGEVLEMVFKNAQVKSGVDFTEMSKRFGIDKMDYAKNNNLMGVVLASARELLEVK